MDLSSEKTNIGIRHMRSVLAVAEERSFIAAAARMFVAPSALTETIKQVEATCGVLLFERKTRPISVTAAGSEFVSDCARIVAMHDNALSALKKIGGLERGTISVAAAPSLLDRVVAPAIKTFCSLHPNIGVAVADEVAGRIEKMVENDDVDFGVAALWRPSSELQAIEIGRDRLGLVCHSSHRLASAPVVRIAEIDPAEIISLLPVTGIAQLLAASEGIPRELLNGHLQAHSTISQLLLVRQNLGIALLPELAASVIRDPELLFLPLADVSVQRRLCLLTRPRRSLSPAAAALAAQIRVVARQLPG